MLSLIVWTVGDIVGMCMIGLLVLSLALWGIYELCSKIFYWLISKIKKLNKYTGRYSGM